MNRSIELILASQSPRRIAYLEQLGVSFHAVPTDVDETLGHFDDPQSAVESLAKKKALACLQQLPDQRLPILAADTLVFLDRSPLGKPENLSDAKRMLRSLSGNTHQVLTNMSILIPGTVPPKNHFCEKAVSQPSVLDASVQSADGREMGNQWLSWTSTAEVTFTKLSEVAIEAYCESKEPMDKAGAYAIQGVGQAFVSEIKGCYSGVVGLPLPYLIPMLDQLGIYHRFTGCSPEDLLSRALDASAQSSEQA